MTFFRITVLGLLISLGLFGQGVVPSHHPTFGQILGRYGQAFSPQMLAPIVGDTHHSAGGGSNPFITGESLGAFQTGVLCVGFKITVGSAPITVTDLARWVISGNSLSHTVHIYNSNGSVDIISAAVATSGAPAGAFKYVSITPTILSASTSYYVMTDETSNSDNFYDSTTTVTTTTDASVVGWAYETVSCGNFPPVDGGGSNTVIGFPSFKYHL
jgi:hypothetical protein